MARYRCIETKIHGDSKFRALSKPQPCGQYLWFYLLTGPHTTCVPGLSHIGEAALAEALGWPLEAFRDAFREVKDQGMVEADFVARVVWVPRVINYNPPTSINVVKSWFSHLNEIPECELKDKAIQVLKAFLEGKGKGFAEAFTKGMSYPGTGTGTGAGTGTGTGTGNKKRARCKFVKPTLAELCQHAKEREVIGKPRIDPEAFLAHYEANGWVQGKSQKPIKNWKAAWVTWEKREQQKEPGTRCRVLTDDEVANYGKS